MSLITMVSAQSGLVSFVTKHIEDQEQYLSNILIYGTHGAHSLKMLSVFHGMLVVGTDAIRV